MNPIRIIPSITQRDPLTDRFFSEIDKYELLTPQQEHDIALDLLKKGIARDDARTMLVVHNLRFAISVAKLYCNLGLPFIDLINEACMGLCQAADAFDPTRNVKFLSFAVGYMRGQILDALEKTGKAISVPHDIANLQCKYRRLCEDTFAEDGRTPTAQEFADYAKIDIKKAIRVIKSTTSIESLDAPIGGNEDDGYYLSDTVVGGMQDSSYIDRESLREALEVALKSELSERDAKAVMAEFGLSNQTLAELSMLYDTNSAALHKAVIRALKHIQHNKAIMARLQEFRNAA